MFTGIIEEIGRVRRLEPRPEGARIAIEAKRVLEETKIGDSIATNGVCLTVVTMDGESFTADVMAETLRMTNLGDLSPGDPVNLERAMSLKGRLGGHLVAGHVDGLARITGKRREGDSLWIDLSLDHGLMRYVLDRGSVALDGTSLTVARRHATGLSVSLIPVTQEETVLSRKNLGQTVNVEVDMIGKYVEQLLTPQKASGIDMNFLKQHGF